MDTGQKLGTSEASWERDWTAGTHFALLKTELGHRLLARETEERPSNYSGQNVLGCNKTRNYGPESMNASGGNFPVRGARGKRGGRGGGGRRGGGRGGGGGNYHGRFCLQPILRRFN